MFFDSTRINSMREMILASNALERSKALEKLLPMQIKDFEDILKIMDSLPVNIRLLDPPLNEFISSNPDEMIKLAKQLGISEDLLKAKINELSEQNPMLGHRGCRLAITYPEIYQMQATAILTAMRNTAAQGLRPLVEIMVPLVLDAAELEIIRNDIEKIADKIGVDKTKFRIGTMIELPRACLVADKIAMQADFFSFGTNDLTQTTLGISRDDASGFMDKYQEKNIFRIDPFVQIDIDGVGSLVKMAVEKALKVKPGLKIGVCGEHGGNPFSIDFFNKVGLDYVSSSPYRIPIAILAAAQAGIMAKKSS